MCYTYTERTGEIALAWKHVWCQSNNSWVKLRELVRKRKTMGRHAKRFQVIVDRIEWLVRWQAANELRRCSFGVLMIVERSFEDVSGRVQKAFEQSQRDRTRSCNYGKYCELSLLALLLKEVRSQFQKSSFGFNDSWSDLLLNTSASYDQALEILNTTD